MMKNEELASMMLGKHFISKQAICMFAVSLQLKKKNKTKTLKAIISL